MMKHIAIVGTAMLLGAGAAQATDVTVGAANSNNCVPFGCSQVNGLTVLQQIYASSQFSGLTTIGSVSFQKDTAVTSPSATLEAMTFNLSFYTTSKAVNGLSTDLSSNIGTLLADFGTFSISGAVPDVMTFASTTAFTYNPAVSNLLLQLTMISDDAGGSGVFFKSDSVGTVSRRMIGSTYGNFGGTNALVTTFSSATAAAPVPEPATWAMFIGGFGLVGGAMRRRQRTTVRFA